jgi:probable HAF family extracellular repeat protein
MFFMYDGRVIVGKAPTAFRWTEAEGMISLGTLAPAEELGVYSEAFAVSATGNAVVGVSKHSRDGPEFEAFLWTPALGMEGLGDFPGDDFVSFAYGVSGDGSVVVGYSEGDFGELSSTRAFV